MEANKLNLTKKKVVDFIKQSMRPCSLFIILSMASFGITFLVSCKHEIKPVQMDFSVDSKGVLMSHGKNYKIIEEPGFSQQELYDMVKSNVMKLYKNPKFVLSENAPTSMAINGYQENLFLYQNVSTNNVSVSYTINVEFKDGKIKISPTMGDVYYDGYDDGYSGTNFSEFFFYIITGWTGKVPSKFKPEYDKINDAMNKIMDSILWGDGTTTNKDDDW